MTEYTPEKVAELVAVARKLLFSDSAFGYEDTKEGDLILRLADALAAVSAERDAAIRDLDAGFAESDHLSAKYYQRMRDAERASSKERELTASLAHIVDRDANLEADRDRLHKAITEALDHDPLHGRSEGLHCGGMSPCIHGILRAALDKEGETK